MYGCTARRGNDSNAPDHLRERTLTLLIEQPHARELLFELLKRQQQRTFTSRFHSIDNQLKVTAVFVQADPRTQLDFVAFFRLKFQQAGARAEHGATHLGSGVF